MDSRGSSEEFEDLSSVLGGNTLESLILFPLYETKTEYLTEIDQLETDVKDNQKLNPLRVIDNLDHFKHLRELTNRLTDDDYENNYKKELCEILDFLRSLFFKSGMNSNDILELSNYILELRTDLKRKIDNDLSLFLDELNNKLVVDEPRAVAPSSASNTASAPDRPYRAWGEKAVERELEESLKLPEQPTELLSDIEECIKKQTQEQSVDLQVITLNLSMVPDEIQPPSKLLAAYQSAIDLINENDELKSHLYAVYNQAYNGENEKESMPSAVKSIIKDLTEVAKSFADGFDAEKQGRLLYNMAIKYDELEKITINPKLRTAIAVAVGAIIGAAIGFTIGLFLGGVTSIPMMFAGAALGLSLASIGGASLATATIAGLCTFKASTSYQAHQKAARDYGVHAVVTNIKSLNN